MRILNLPESYQNAFTILGRRLAVDEIDVTVRFALSDTMTVGFKNGEGYVKCNEKHHFARLLGLFCHLCFEFCICTLKSGNLLIAISCDAS